MAHLSSEGYPHYPRSYQFSFGKHFVLPWVVGVSLFSDIPAINCFTNPLTIDIWLSTIHTTLGLLISQPLTNCVATLQYTMRYPRYVPMMLGISGGWLHSEHVLVGFTWPMACEAIIAMEYMPIFCAWTFRKTSSEKPYPPVIKHGKQEHPSLCSMEFSQL